MAQPTTFPRPTFAKLSPHPFLLANLQPTDPSIPPARTNGRGPTDARPVNINTGSLSHAQGSAVVRAGDTTVICGVRAEVLPVANIPQFRAGVARKVGVGEDVDEAGREARQAEGRRELRDYDLLVLNIELATGCAPQFLPGVLPTTLAQTLSSRVFSLLHASSLLDVDDLRVWYTPTQAQSSAQDGDGDEEMGQDDKDDQDDADGDEEEQQPQLKAFWTLYIDVLFISFDGNPFDVAWTAVVAALRDTRLPHAWWDADREMVLCSRSQPSQPLSIRGMPVACTAAVFREKDDPDGRGRGDGTGDQYWVLVDPDRLEESLCDEAVTVVVDRSPGGGDGEGRGSKTRSKAKATGAETQILSILKSGGTAVGPEFLQKFVGVAEKRWEAVQEAMK